MTQTEEMKMLNHLDAAWWNGDPDNHGDIISALELIAPLEDLVEVYYGRADIIKRGAKIADVNKIEEKYKK